MTVLPPEYRLKCILRAHSPSNDPEDDYTEVWYCAFEPKHLGTHGAMVATCGGNSVCLVDCSQGKVMKKYKHLEEETFLVLAWTILSRKGTDWPILAVAGTQGDVKLLDTSQLVCYAYLRGHKKDITAMDFSPMNPSRLLTASLDKSVILWNIGIPEGKDHLSNNQLLCKFEGSPSPLISLAWTVSGDGLVAGCDDLGGVIYYKMLEIDAKEMEAGAKSDILDSPIVKKYTKRFFGDEEEYHGSNVDCIRMMNDDIVVSKGACDGELIVWDLKASLQDKRCPPKVVAFITWETTDLSFIRFQCVPDNKFGGNHLLVIGGPSGDIRIYEFLRNAQMKDNNRVAPVLVEPSIQLQHAQSKNSIIRCVDMSHDGNHIVAVNENNCILIWDLTCI